MPSSPETDFPTPLSLRVFERIVDTELDHCRFDDLLALATEACLYRAPEYVTDVEPAVGEAAVIAQIGVRGLGHALDMRANEQILIKPYGEEKSDTKVSSDSIITVPGYMNGPMDRVAAKNIEIFGAAVLDEAYRSLGTDVKEKIDRFKTATTPDEQIEVLEWLYLRIKSMTDDKSSEALGYSDDEPYYHPIRLSPKALGIYPRQNYDPTCLGKSILAASFLKQTGADYLHAGSMATHADGSYIDLSIINSVLARSGMFSFNPALESRLNANGRKLYTGFFDSGFHAATVTRLMDGAWFVVDPNFGSAYEVDNERADKALSQAYDELVEFKELAPGLERTVTTKRSGWVMAYFEPFFEQDAFEVTDEELNDALCGSDESIGASVVEYVLAKFAAMDYAYSDRFSFQDYVQYLDEMPMARRDIDVETTVLHEACTVAMNKYLFWGNDPAKVMDRCRADRQYREARREDLAVLPHLVFAEAMVLMMQIQEGLVALRHFSEKDIHSVLELGLPEFRVGATILSDFASYCGDELSPDFWFSNWGSKIPVTERMNTDNQTQFQDERVQNNVSWLACLNLKYVQQNGIIDKQRSSRKG